MPQVPRLLRAKTALAVIDIQQRLLPAMFQPDRVVQNTLRLVNAAPLLHVAVIATEQYPKGLGPTVPEILDVMAGVRPIDKMVFSAAASAHFMRALRAKNAQSVLLCGIEAHVCVAHTCLDLIENGMQVFVAHDATSSRTEQNWQLAADRMRQAGAVITSTEAAIFELLHTADDPEFKKILAMVK